jgi:hypothetical protein
VHTEEAGMIFVMVATLAIGGFLAISGLVGVLTAPSMTREEAEEALIDAQERAGRPISVSSAIAIYVLFLAVVAALIVGIATRDTGAGIQTFTFGLILGGVVWGLGLLLGHRPVEE